MERADDVTPLCHTSSGCPIPHPGPEGTRILRMRGHLLRLGDLVDSGTVLRMYGATREDLDLLAAIEAELGEMEK